MAARAVGADVGALVAAAPVPGGTHLVKGFIQAKEPREQTGIDAVGFFHFGTDEKIVAAAVHLDAVRGGNVGEVFGELDLQLFREFRKLPTGLGEPAEVVLHLGVDGGKTEVATGGVALEPAAEMAEGLDVVLGRVAQPPAGPRSRRGRNKPQLPAVPGLRR